LYVFISIGKKQILDKIKKEELKKIERQVEALFEGAKVWVNGRLVMDNGWKDEEWWDDKVKKAIQELKEGKTILGYYKGE